MTESGAWVKLALNILKCNQQQLAARLKVSPTQVTKWKNGDSMSSAMEANFRKLTKIHLIFPSFVLWAGSREAAQKWHEVIHTLGERTADAEENGYAPEMLRENGEILDQYVYLTLTGLGVKPPNGFPAELEEWLASEADPDVEDAMELIYDNPYTNLIYNLFHAVVDLFGFYEAYIQNLWGEQELDSDVNTAGQSIEDCLLNLAACKIEVDETFAPKYRAFRVETLQDYMKWLNILKEDAYRTGKPLRAELMDLISKSAGEIGLMVEENSPGITGTQLHPDIYMNELLVGMRIINQTLPAIAEKLGVEVSINENESMADWLPPAIRNASPAKASEPYKGVIQMPGKSNKKKPT